MCVPASFPETSSQGEALYLRAPHAQVVLEHHDLHAHKKSIVSAEYTEKLHTNAFSNMELDR